MLQLNKLRQTNYERLESRDTTGDAPKRLTSSESGVYWNDRNIVSLLKIFRYVSPLIDSVISWTIEMSLNQSHRTKKPHPEMCQLILSIFETSQWAWKSSTLRPTQINKRLHGQFNPYIVYVHSQYFSRQSTWALPSILPGLRLCLWPP